MENVCVHGKTFYTDNFAPGTWLLLSEVDPVCAWPFRIFRESFRIDGQKHCVRYQTAAFDDFDSSDMEYFDGMSIFIDQFLPRQIAHSFFHSWKCAESWIEYDLPKAKHFFQGWTPRKSSPPSEEHYTSLVHQRIFGYSNIHTTLPEKACFDQLFYCGAGARNATYNRKVSLQHHVPVKI